MAALPLPDAVRILASAIVATAASAGAQAVTGGDLVTADFGSNSLFRVTPAGVVSTLYAGAPLQSPSGVAVGNAREVLVADFAGTLYALTSPGSLTPVAGGLAGPIRVAVDRNGDYLVTELTAPALTRVTPGGSVTQIYQGAPLQRPFGIAVDGNGDYLVTDDRSQALYRITPGGSLSTIHQGPPFRLPQGVAVLANGDFAVIDGIVDAVFRVPRGGGIVSTIVATPAIDNPDGVVADFEGGVFVSESSVFGNRIDHVRQNGTVTTLAQGPPFANLEAIARTPRLIGPSQGKVGQVQTFDLEIPADANLPYAAYAVLSLFPGVQLPGGDPRGTPCNLDFLFVITAGANNSVFQSFGGMLSGSGKAQPAINMPSSVVIPPGTTLFLQALTIDLSAPNVIGSFSNVHALTY